MRNCIYKCVFYVRLFRYLIDDRKKRPDNKSFNAMFNFNSSSALMKKNGTSAKN